MIMTLAYTRIWMTSVMTLSLAGCLSSLAPTSFTLEFPTQVLGELWIREDVNCFTCGNGEKNLGPATGKHDVRLPAGHWYVSLKMPTNAGQMLHHLAHPSLSHIGDLDLRGSNVKDEDLRHIAGLNLRSINLERTKITGAGLKYLKPHPKWVFVNLQNCAELDPRLLVHFRGWKRSTIRLLPYKWNGDTYSSAETRLLDSARKIICNGQPEDVCGTQIR